MSKIIERLIFVLLILNLWMFIPSIWGTWEGFAFIHAIKGNTSGLLTLILLGNIKGYAVLILTTWGFLKKWRGTVVLYLLYLSYFMPLILKSTIQRWQNKSIFLLLSSSLYTHTAILIWLICLITFCLILFEIDYKNLFNNWKNHVSNRLFFGS
ncbi:MAG: hypothetical protein JSR33_11410 [Proteobacteria bacterium]|nr:hypothetical protein [Pseudomonadota bacterium]